MGKIKVHPAVKAFTAISYPNETILEKVIEILKDLLGPVELMSNSYSVNTFTNYYEPEMGSETNKILVSFKYLILAETLADIKNKTNEIEQQFLDNNLRTVNIDPGYLTQAKVVLATTKDYSHRIYLGKGIFADLHLSYQDKAYRPQVWTYPDYKQKQVIEFFSRLREHLRSQEVKIFKKT